MRWASATGSCGSSRSVEQHHELVAAQPGHDVVGAQHAHAAARPTATSSWSPAVWPSESLTTLNRSRSRKSTATEPGRAARRGPGCGRSWSRSSARLASPVSGSCRAWWASSASLRLRAVMSVFMTSTCSTSPSSPNSGTARDSGTTAPRRRRSRPPTRCRAGGRCRTPGGRPLPRRLVARCAEHLGGLGDHRRPPCERSELLERRAGVDDATGRDRSG